MIRDEFVEINESTLLGITHIREDFKPYQEQIKAAHREGVHHPTKILEWIASRELLKDLVEKMNLRYMGIVKNGHGKPFDPLYRCHFSISHSYPMVCAIASRNPVGIDIEKQGAKISRIARRFCSEEELLYSKMDPIILLKIWCAKEAIYKAMGRKGLSFKNEIAIFELDKNNMEATGIISTKDKQLRLKLFFRTVGDYTICYTFDTSKQINSITGVADSQ